MVRRLLSNPKPATTKNAMQKLRLALDWTPNINHIGFFVAEDQGFYRDEGLEVEISDPSIDNYAVTPAKKLETGAADVAVCPTESLISYRTKATPFPIVAIAALLQKDLSAIAVRENSPIRTPKELDGKTYASYHARYEDDIVREMIRNDGGTGELGLVHPDKLGIWDTLVNGTYDATWVFRNWEGVEADAKGLELRYFNLEDYNIPYGYSPVIAASVNAVRENEELYRKFLAATKRGYQFTQENPGESVGILERVVPASDHDISVKKALALTTPYLGNPHTWGRMKPSRFDDFLNWLSDHKLETRPLKATDLYRNDLIP